MTLALKVTKYTEQETDTETSKQTTECHKRTSIITQPIQILRAQSSIIQGLGDKPIMGIP